MHFNINNCIIIIYVIFHIQEDQSSIHNLETISGLASIAILFSSLTNLKIHSVFNLNTHETCFMFCNLA